MFNRQAVTKPPAPAPETDKPGSVVTNDIVRAMIAGFDKVYRPVIERVFLRATSTTGDLVFPVVPPSKMWVITSWSTQDETTAFTGIKWYIQGKGYDHPLDEVTGSLTASKLWAFSNLPIYLPEGCNLMARLAGVTSGDRLTSFINGVEVVVR